MTDKQRLTQISAFFSIVSFPLWTSLMCAQLEWSFTVSALLAAFISSFLFMALIRYKYFPQMMIAAILAMGVIHLSAILFFDEWLGFEYSSLQNFRGTTSTQLRDMALPDLIRDKTVIVPVDFKYAYIVESFASQIEVEDSIEENDKFLPADKSFKLYNQTNYLSFIYNGRPAGVSREAVFHLWTDGLETAERIVMFCPYDDNYDLCIMPEPTYLQLAGKEV